MSARPVVQVFATAKAGEVVANVTLPGVFRAPIRPDVVQTVHTNIAKNKRQAYAVAEEAGHQVSAISWGTGRAVARIPRVNGSGTHRAGQGAFGNMCRGGRMFAPTKTWRKWHRKVNLKQRRYAVASALAATAIAPIVMARGHNIEQVAEIPLVLSNEVESVQKTKEAVAILNAHGCAPELARVANSKQVRSGKGKWRNRRYTQRVGPLVVYKNDNGITRAFRNIAGVELCQVDRLNLLQLAPGGHLGRFVIWTAAAFEHLDNVYGTPNKASSTKKSFKIARPMMTNTDVSRLINSDEIQSVVRPAIKSQKYVEHKKNPLKNFGVMLKLNPHAKVTRRATLIASAKRAAFQRNKRKADVDTKKALLAQKKAFTAKLLAE